MATNSVQNLSDLYDYYNHRLFGLELPACIVNCVQGLFLRTFVINGKNNSNEINFRSDWFKMEDVTWNAQFVHEMTHIWQSNYTPSPRRLYHNKEWGQKMYSLGLCPSSTGQPGGNDRGFSLSQYPIENGPFIKAFNDLTDKELLTVKSHYSTGNGFAKNSLDISARKEKTVKYTCDCGHEFKGLPGIDLTCCTCDSRLRIESRKPFHKPKP